MCSADDQSRQHAPRRRDPCPTKVGHADRVCSTLRLYPRDRLQLGEGQARTPPLLAAADRGWTRSRLCTALRARCNERPGRVFRARCRVNRGLAPHTLVATPSTNPDAGGLASTRTDTVPAGRDQGGTATNLAAFPARGSVRKESPLSNRGSVQHIHAPRLVETATTSNVCGTATIGPTLPLVPTDVAADSNARAHQLAKETSSSHDDTGARETRRQRDATTA